MFQKIRVLSSESIEEFRAAVLTSPGTEIKPLSSYIDQYDLTSFETSYEIDVDLELQIDSGDNKESDKVNAMRMVEALSGVSWQALRDEGLWISLAFEHFLDYAKCRWPLGVSGSKRKNLENHWFPSTTRSLWRDHAISRLWWMGRYCKELQTIEPSSALDVIYVDSEFANSFFGRPVTISSKVVAESVLRHFHQKIFVHKEFEFSRKHFRLFMKELDLAMGSVYVDSLSNRYVYDLVEALSSNIRREMSHV